MGFYGNIKNTSRTQFSFDKIYPNRAALDGRGNGQKTGAAVDDIYAGRFVLVEYDSNVTEDQFISAILFNGVLYSTIPNSVNGTLVPIVAYQSDDDEENTSAASKDSYYIIKGKYNFDEMAQNADGTVTFPKDKFVQLLGTNGTKENEFYYSYDSKNNELIKYSITNEDGEVTIPTRENFSYAEYKDVPWSAEDNNYFKNYNIDIGIYGVSRGYDSTVWQKVYTNGTPKYVMIAELNSVVPTFDLAADAPSLFPNIPHFDSDSTNVYYRLHWQPQWGMRLKASDPTLRTPYLQTNGEAYASTGSTANTTLVRENDIREYPSDETTTWSHSVFDNNNQYQKTEYFVPKDNNGHSSWMNEDAAKNYEALNAAIYYNKAGFDPKIVSYSQDKTYNGWGTTGLVTDEILITPTGISGHQYKSHNPIERESVQPDIQELSIMLPSIGDTIASVWDIVYGGRNIDPDATTRNMDISWYNAKTISNKQGIRLIESTSPGQYTYNIDNAGTLAGILNSAQDLMGMIITDEKPDDPADANDQYIYYDVETKKYYFKHKTYEYETQYVGTGDTKIPDDYSFYQEEKLEEWNNDYYYIDILSTAKDTTRVDYISEKSFYPDKKYVEKNKIKACMKEITLSKAYQPDTFYYRSSDSYSSENASTYNYFAISKDSYDSTKKYYEFKPADKQIEKGEAVYVPGTYYTASYTKVTLTKNTYEPGLYYVKYGGASGATFYLQLDLSEEDFAENWSEIVDSELIICSDSYLKIRTPFEKETIFKRGYSLATELTADPSVKYYKLKISASESNAFYTLVSSTVEETIFSPSANIYYEVETKEEADREINGKFYKKETNSSAVDNRQYYFIQDKYELQQGADIVNIKDEDVEEITNMFSISDYKTGSIDKGKGTDLFYIYKDSAGIERYIEVTYSNLSKAYNTYTQNYELVVMEYSVIGSPYYKNKYYYHVEDESSEYNDSYLMDNNDGLTEKRTYYEFIPEGLTDNDVMGKQLTGFFAAGKYYIEYPENSGTYIIANDQFKESEKYYNRSITLYVTKDPQGIYDEGSVWPLEVKNIPEGVELSTRKDAWEYQELEGLNDKLTTMYGALLRLQKTLNEQDTLTRDSDTIRGTINLINDITHRFSDLIPGQLTIVDDYGRMHSAELTTAQGLKYAGQVGDKKTDMAEKEKAENALIAIDINSDYKNPTISIIHTKPETIESTIGTTDLNDRDNDNIALQTFVYDDAGHIVAEHNETYTLPYGFKTVSIANSTAETELATNTTAITADNSKDTMTLAAANKWIRFAGTDGTSNKIEIAHALVSTSFGGKKDNSQDTTPAFGDKIKVPVITTDNAGHVTAFETEEVKIPGWTFEDKDSPNTADIVLDVTYNYDTTNDIGTLTKTRGNIDKLLIQDYVIDGVASAKLVNTDSIHGAFAKLQAQINNMDLDKVGGSEGEYITDITEIDGVVTANKAALPTVDDEVKDGAFVTSVSEKYGKITVTRTDLKPSVTIGAGTVNTAPTIQVTVNGKTSGDPVALTMASTEVYGVVKLTNQFISSDNTLAITGQALQAAITGLQADGIADLAANKTIKTISQTNGKISVDTQDIKIETNQVTGLDDSITGINESIESINTFIGSVETEEATESLYSMIKALQDEVAALKTKIEEYHPTTETDPEVTPTE